SSHIYTLSLHDALPISTPSVCVRSAHPGAQGVLSSLAAASLDPQAGRLLGRGTAVQHQRHDAAGCADRRILLWSRATHRGACERSEEHTSELQSPDHLV